jgi:predicted DNA-binding transcriptional regulator AlpA
VATSILRIEDVSKRTGIPVNTLRFYRATNTGPKSFRLGRRVVYMADDVEAWIQAAYNAEVGA